MRDLPGRADTPPADLPLNRFSEACFKINLRLEAEQRARSRDVGHTTLDVLVLPELGIGNELEERCLSGMNELPDQLCKRADRDLLRIPEIQDEIRLIALEYRDDPVDVIADVGERARLCALTVNRQRLPIEGALDEDRLRPTPPGQVLVGPITAEEPEEHDLESQ